MTKTYEQFLSEPISYSISSYGGGAALGLRGPREWIDKIYNMFCNLDSNRKLVWLDHEFAYISCPPTKKISSLDRIKSVIKLHLYLNILHNREVEVSEGWNEETGEYILIQDEERADRLAEDESNDWIARLKTESFISANRA